MGYDLHITRAESWSENDGAKTSADEWLALVARDPELTIMAEHGPHFATWSGASVNPGAWFDWFDGDVFTKNPDSATLRKMIALANLLGARVQGDDGELYTGDEPLDEHLAGRERSSGGRRSLWQRLFGR